MLMHFKNAVLLLILFPCFLEIDQETTAFEMFTLGKSRSVCWFKDGFNAKYVNQQ